MLMPEIRHTQASADMQRPIIQRKLQLPCVGQSHELKCDQQSHSGINQKTALISSGVQAQWKNVTPFILSPLREAALQDRHLLEAELQHLVSRNE